MTPSPSLQQLAEAAAVDIVNREYHEDVPSNIYTVRDVILKHLTPLEQERQALAARVKWFEEQQEQFLLATAQLQELMRKAKALDSIERLCDKTPLAIWKGEWADNDQNIRLGRVGAPIVTVCTMDADGSESNADDIGEGGSVLEAIEQAMRKEKV